MRKQWTFLDPFPQEQEMKFSSRPGQIIPLTTLLLVLNAICPAADWTDWRGSERDGYSEETGLLSTWPTDGPDQLWMRGDIGVGYSSPAVKDSNVYITGVVGQDLVLHCLDLQGELRWRKIVGPGWTGRVGGHRSFPGTRTAPVLDENRLYLTSGHGTVYCLRAEDGEQVWSLSMKDYNSELPHWGVAEHVLIVDDKAVFTPGGDAGMVAVDKRTGREMWQTGAIGDPHYCSAIYVVHNCVPMIIQGGKFGLLAVHANTGDILWKDAHAEGNRANCPTPAYADGYVVWAVGYGKGAVCLKLDDDGMPERAWQNQNLVNHHGGYIIHEGYLYGHHNAEWASLDLKTGETVWKAKGVGKGSVSFADGMLYTYGEENGVCELVRATPEGFVSAGRVQVTGQREAWAHPVIAAGRLFLRFGANLYCFDISASQ